MHSLYTITGAMTFIRSRINLVLALWKTNPLPSLLMGTMVTTASDKSAWKIVFVLPNDSLFRFACLYSSFSTRHHSGASVRHDCLSGQRRGLPKRPITNQSAWSVSGQCADFIFFMLMIEYQIDETLIKLTPLIFIRWCFCPMAKQLEFLYDFFAKVTAGLILEFRYFFGLAD